MNVESICTFLLFWLKAVLAIHKKKRVDFSRTLRKTSTGCSVAYHESVMLGRQGVCSVVLVLITKSGARVCEPDSTSQTNTTTQNTPSHTQTHKIIPHWTPLPPPRSTFGFHSHQNEAHSDFVNIFCHNVVYLFINKSNYPK